MEIDPKKSLQLAFQQLKEFSIPGVGTFRKQMRPAVIDHQNKKVLPPEEGFELESGASGGHSLASFFQQHLKLDASQAASLTGKVSNLLKRETEEGQQMLIPGVGVVKCNPEGVYSLEPVGDILANLGEHFGLKAVQYTSEPKPEKVVEDKLKKAFEEAESPSRKAKSGDAGTGESRKVAGKDVAGKDVAGKEASGKDGSGKEAAKQAGSAVPAVDGKKESKPAAGASGKSVQQQKAGSDKQAEVAGKAGVAGGKTGSTQVSDAGKEGAGKAVARKVEAGKAAAGKAVVGKVEAGTAAAGRVEAGKAAAGKAAVGKAAAGKVEAGKTAAGKAVVGGTVKESGKAGSGVKAGEPGKAVSGKTGPGDQEGSKKPAVGAAVVGGTAVGKTGASGDAAATGDAASGAAAAAGKTVEPKVAVKKENKAAVRRPAEKKKKRRLWPLILLLVLLVLGGTGYVLRDELKQVLVDIGIMSGEDAEGGNAEGNGIADGSGGNDGDGTNGSNGDPDGAGNDDPDGEGIASGDEGDPDGSGDPDGTDDPVVDGGDDGSDSAVDPNVGINPVKGQFYLIVGTATSGSGAKKVLRANRKSGGKSAIIRPPRGSKQYKISLYNSTNKSEVIQKMVEWKDTYTWIYYVGMSK